MMWLPSKTPVLGKNFLSEVFTASIYIQYMNSALTNKRDVELAAHHILQIWFKQFTSSLEAYTSLYTSLKQCGKNHLATQLQQWVSPGATLPTSDIDVKLTSDIDVKLTLSLATTSSPDIRTKISSSPNKTSSDIDGASSPIISTKMTSKKTSFSRKGKLHIYFDINFVSVHKI